MIHNVEEFYSTENITKILRESKMVHSVDHLAATQYLRVRATG